MVSPARAHRREYELADDALGIPSFRKPCNNALQRVNVPPVRSDRQRISMPQSKLQASHLFAGRSPGRVEVGVIGESHLSEVSLRVGRYQMSLQSAHDISGSRADIESQAPI